MSFCWQNNCNYIYVQDFIMQQTMYRIKDPKKSLEFYSKVLGMRLLQKFDFPEMKFSLYFMGYEKAEEIPKDRKERTKWMFTRKATIELTHNWGTENEDIQYHNGNSDPRGFGPTRSAVLVCGRRPRTNTADQGPVNQPIRNPLINDIFISDSPTRSAVLVCGRRPRTNTADQGPVNQPIRNPLINDIFISDSHIGLHVPDVEKACERFEKLGVEFVKKPNDGKMKGLAFIKDPDGYWIEILSSNNMSEMIK